MPYSERSPLLGPQRVGVRRRSLSPLPAPHPHGPLRHRGTAGDGTGAKAATTSGSRTAIDNEDALDDQWHHLTEDDIAIEGMVLVLLSELEQRGYMIPSGLVDVPLDMPEEEAEAERALFRTVFAVPRHRGVLEQYLPYLPRATVAPNEPRPPSSPSGASSPQHLAPVPAPVPAHGAATPHHLAHSNLSSSSSSAATTATTTTAAAEVKVALHENDDQPTKDEATEHPNGLAPPPAPPHRPTPSPSYLELRWSAGDIISSPSALLLCALLSLLISLQEEVTTMVQETDRGVDGELRMFKARRDLGERLYAVVGGLLDSYLLTGDAHPVRSTDSDHDNLHDREEPEDALVTLLFHDFPLHYDSTDRATCDHLMVFGPISTTALDLLLNLTSYPLVEAEDLVSHPVILASTEYVWRNGLLPPPRQGVDTSLSWTESFVRLDRFSIPRILHAQTYIHSTLHAAATIYILTFSAYAHFDSLNPLDPTVPVKNLRIPEHGRPHKTWSVFTSLVWWLWVAGVFGWAADVLRAWHHRGPHPSLPLSPSTLLPLLHHALVLASLLLRLSGMMWKRPPAFLFASSLSLLAWSIPFLAASRILPQNLPMFGSPTHMRWEKIRDGRRRRDVGYRPPPKTVPVSHRALRSLEAQLGGLVQFGSYFTVLGLLLLWSLSGELDYPGLLMSPVTVVDSVSTYLSAPKQGPVSPIEARTTLAFTLILGVVLAYFAGGRPSESGKTSRRHKELDDLDGWDRYGREVAFRARRERLAVNRYFSFVPPPLHQHSLESVPSAFGMPPLPSPLNLWIAPLALSGFIARRWFGREDWARRVHERGRLWIWRAGVAPLGLWAVIAKGVRTVRKVD
ncbi:BQ2448_1909 [Microbotryum intermedium]|uniref:BQ2448_1909 protein n=1 Tax=Microbotryum intermedium TaxID=269621 RepID=A0A238FBE9_9BASI|nr:BQ2448_1909 [Microbotryum intermedium]